MKKDWSSKWVGSSQPRKQRKYRYNAPLHTKHKLVSVRLSKELKSQYRKRSVPVRKGDEVRVMTGSSKRSSGNVSKVDLNKLKIYIEGITVKKVDGSEVMKPIDPSNLMITKLNIDDKMRRKQFERKNVKDNAAKEKKEPQKDANKQKEQKL